ncbi:MAG: 50S ribosomal protein L11 methyltransferase [Holosporales bacterium]|jgi:ribosomal protein L11 methyltransferase|nr:50S ribosomal protein L11 methyltransferase [Holosporales bacterium]
MFALSFVIHHSALSELDNFLESLVVCNYSVFENLGKSLSDFLDEDGFPIAKFFNVEILEESEFTAKELKVKIEQHFKHSIFETSISAINNQDWIELYKKELTPIICGKFFFYNDNLQKPEDTSALIPIKLNSALAFGSGHHQTTKSCLLNMEYLNDINFCPKRILDMGCGTGILGICALKIWPDAKLLGIDIDKEAVDITIVNYKSNNIKANAIQASDIKHITSKFDLIFCNILKQPLIELSKQFDEKLENNGRIITSGYTKNQEAEIIKQYCSLDFELENRIIIYDWLSIIFRKA